MVKNLANGEKESKAVQPLRRKARKFFNHYRERCPSDKQEEFYHRFLEKQEEAIMKADASSSRF